MAQEKKSDIKQLEGILKQFDNSTILNVIKKLGLSPEKRKVLPEYVLGMSIIEAAKILKTNRLGEFQLFQRGLVAGVGLGALPLAITAVTGITLKCNTSVTLYSKQGGTATEYDLPGGNTAVQVQAAAISNANSDALQNVRNDLIRQANEIHCPSGCTKVIGAPAVATVTAATITSSSTGGTIYDSYTATGDAEGTLTVTC